VSAGRVRSTFSGFIGYQGVPVYIHEGEERPADDELARAFPQHFVAIAAVAEPRGRGRRSADA
jgi:hypothetical protein